ncbi:MAG: hypothetical protein K2P85_03325 [Flavobacteriaceae bacterium]|nr:hypothetical protein [Flavobacteriaceae bacterium]
MKNIFVICVLLLLIAVLELPIVFYNILRVAITIGAFIGILFEIKKGVNLWGISFIYIMLLLNTILPIYLSKKNYWIPIDIAVALLFIIYGIKKNNQNLNS